MGHAANKLWMPAGHRSSLVDRWVGSESLPGPTTPIVMDGGTSLPLRAGDHRSLERDLESPARARHVDILK
ncbi:hypothetical protein EJB05_58081, partial [Eragrostis curvula]